MSSIMLGENEKATAATPLIRQGRRDDASAINELYNHYIRETPATFDIEPYTLEAREGWLSKFSGTGPHRLFVAEHEGRVVGYATSSEFRSKAAYRPSVETSIYVDFDMKRAGIGRALYSALFDALADEDVHRAYAGVTVPNPASEALHEQFGFKPVGRFSEVGRKFGKYWDVVWYEKALD